MAIITATVIGGTALSAVGAGTIAAGVAFAGAAANTAVSLNQSKKAKKAQGEAEAQADKALSSARERLDMNYLEGLSIQKEPYELQREALLAGGAQALQAAQSGERGVSAAAGRVAIAQQAGQAEIRTAMGREMADLEMIGLKEESRLRDMQAGIDVQEAKGATLAAQQAAEDRAIAQQGIAKGISGMGKSASSMIPEYPKTGGGTDNQGDFAGVGYGTYKDQGGTMSRGDYKNILGGGTQTGNLLAGVGETTSGLFEPIFRRKN
jgi:hypothetical protein